MKRISSRMRQLVKYIETLLRVLIYGERYHSYRLVTPKWARASMREENRFRRAMKRGDRPQIPIIKRGRLATYIRLNGHLPTLEKYVGRLQDMITPTAFVSAFHRRTISGQREGMVDRFKFRFMVRKFRDLIRYTISY